MSRVSLGERVLALRAQREAAHRRRRIRTVARREGVRCEVDGRELLNFCSNDYLGLAAGLRPGELAQATPSGWGAGASPLVTGRSHSHAALERALGESIAATHLAFLRGNVTVEIPSGAPAREELARLLRPAAMLHERPDARLTNGGRV